MEKKDRLSFGEWVENVWYRYKWLLIIGALLLIFALIAVVQLISNKSPDVSILYVGPEYITQVNREKLYDSVASLSSDYNGDGKVTTNLLDITLQRVPDVSSPDNYALYDDRNTALQRFQTEIRVGDALIYILDRTYFDNCVELGILSKLSDVLGEKDVPADNIDGYGIEIGSIDARYLPGIADVIPGDMVICLRRTPEADEINYGRKTNFWENNRKTFEKIVTYRK